MSKNIVLCCDGTANEFAKNNTNVVKLYSTLLNDSSQVTYYHPGLGTMEPAGALTTFARKVTKFLGLAFGYGLENDIRDAYAFLMHYYEPGDRVYMFGFSRGAYTVRAVAALLRMYGLIRPGNESLVPYAIRMMLAIKRGQNAGGADSNLKDYFKLAGDFKAMMTRTDCKPWFVGVWDTVSSVGWIENPLKLPYVSDNPDIAIGRHAIAIDEKRAFFRTHLWRPKEGAANAGPKDLKQVWFPGVHCDVGGGYAEEESGLAKEALQWMLDEAEEHGMSVDPAKRNEILGLAGGDRYEVPNPDGKMHESLKSFWHIAEFIPKKHFDWQTKTEERRCNFYRRRTIPEKPLVHASAFERKGYAMWIPRDAIRVERKQPTPTPPASSTPPATTTNNTQP